jgi:hypothetical protein
MDLRRKNSMRNGRIAKGPSASRDELKARMECVEEVGMLMTRPNDLPRRSGPHPFFLLKPGQSSVEPFVAWTVWAKPALSLPYIVGRMPRCTTHGGWPLRRQEGGQAIRNCHIVPGQTWSNPVKPGQNEGRGLTVKLQRACSVLQIARKLPKNFYYN